MIDSTAYPHIIDHILCYAAASTLLAARNTSRASRKLADKLLVDVVPCPTCPPSFRSMKLPAPQPCDPRKEMYGRIVEANLSSTRTLQLSWVGSLDGMDDSFDLDRIEDLLYPRPNVELVIMLGQRSLVAPYDFLWEFQEKIRRTHPNTYCIPCIPSTSPRR